MSDFNISLTYLENNGHDWDAAEEREIEKKRGKWHKKFTLGELNRIEDKKDEINTKRRTKWAVNILWDFLAQTRMDSNFEKYTADALNETLQEFYAAVQSTKAGGEYSIDSLRSVRAAINHFLIGLNVKTDSRFRTSNVVFKLY